jgi:uncharacterized membrane protein
VEERRDRGHQIIFGLAMLGVGVYDLAVVTKYSPEPVLGFVLMFIGFYLLIRGISRIAEGIRP